jgi:hypothetical protein
MLKYDKVSKNCYLYNALFAYRDRKVWLLIFMDSSDF